MLTEVYAAGEAPIAGADGKALARAIRARGRIDPVLVRSARELPAALAPLLRDGDLLLLLGAGDIGHVAPRDRGRRLRLEAASMSRHLTDPRAFGRVAVVMGGTSAEREVSLNSGANVLEALRARGRRRARRRRHAGAARRPARRPLSTRVFNILHGRGGEDGVLQGALEALGVPYTGSGVLGSALSMDKVRTKQVWQALGLPTPRYARYRARRRRARGDRRPRPAGDRQALARGLQRRRHPRRSPADLSAAVELAARYDGELLIEQLIEGGEYTVGILDGEALPSIRIVPAGEYYDYHAKYVADDTQYLCPGLEGEAEAQMRATRACAPSRHPAPAAGAAST